MPIRTYLSLGSNVGDRERHLREAIARLSAFGSVGRVSSLYETEPVEVTDQAWFLNCAVAFDTELKPEQLLAEILEIEKRMGRIRTREKGPRTIDIDILLYGDVVLDSAELTIPHPAMHQRRFVLEPLAEIAPHVRPPGANQTVRQLLKGLPEGQTARRV